MSIDSFSAASVNSSMSESTASIDSFSATSIDSSDDTIVSSDIDPLLALQEGLDEIEREINRQQD